MSGNELWCALLLLPQRLGWLFRGYAKRPPFAIHGDCGFEFYILKQDEPSVRTGKENALASPDSALRLPPIRLTPGPLAIQVRGASSNRIKLAILPVE